ncbi:MAG: hypothetical protein IPK39_03195 [Sulfuritalea sp.]|nr:hypothetical protein [Sulfuritalea sp.]
MNFDLPGTGTDQSPVFLNAADCRAWLAALPLANAAQAQPMISHQLNLLHRFALPPTERFAILESLRGPLSEVQDLAARAFAGKPLPLEPHEQASLDGTLAVWHLLALGYLRCFAALCVADEGMAPAPALLAQRTLSVFADWQVDLCRGEQLPDASYWNKLHQVFSAAEVLGIAARSVSDPVRHGNVPTSALAAYGECNLLNTANLYELPARHLAWVARWARRWGAKLALLKTPPEDMVNRAVPLWVDLDSDRPATYVPQSATGGRWLDTTELRKSLLARIALLEQGRAPAELQLGDDVTQPAAGQLLQRALQRWCKGGTPRRFERQVANSACRLIVGFAAVHYHLSGRQPFQAHTRDAATLRREREEFEVFGDRRQSGPDTAKLGDSAIEEWQVMDDWRLLNESIAGLRISRPIGEGVRVGAGLLIAIKRHDAQRFALANLRWALREADGVLAAGIQIFAGEARSVALRTVEPGAARGSWQQGFLLPEIAAPDAPPSIVAPAGTFRIEREIEVMVDQQARVFRLLRLLDLGLEFERCSMQAGDSNR